MKKCTKCGVKKPLSEFNKRSDLPFSYYSHCKECRKMARNEWSIKNKDRVKQYNKKAKLKNNWGLTEEQFSHLKNKQQNACAICKEPFVDSKNTHIDHCHKTGIVRGILCANCNHGLGKFKDSSDFLKSALKYLKKYSAKTLEKQHQKA